MTPEARLIARHHLGEHLRDVIPVGSGYNVLIHLGDGGYRGAFASEAEDLPAVCQEAAAQLRAAGWVPTHARLEWERDGDAIRLVLLLDKVRSVQLDGQLFDNGTGWLAFESADIAGYPAIVATMIAAAERWHAATAPSLHLPPFPGDKP